MVVLQLGLVPRPSSPVPQHEGVCRAPDPPRELGPQRQSGGETAGPSPALQGARPGFQRGGRGDGRRTRIRRASSGTARVGGAKGSQLCPRGLQFAETCGLQGALDPHITGPAQPRPVHLTWAEPPASHGRQAVTTLCFVSTGRGDLGLRAADHPEEGAGQA